MTGRRPGAPDLVVLSGDITQRARRRQFAARAFIERLSLPAAGGARQPRHSLFNVLARALNPYGNYKRALGAVLEPVSRPRPAGHRRVSTMVAHHPVRAKVESDVHNLLFGRERALAAWTRPADLILGGHIHLPYVMPISADGPTAGCGARGHHMFLRAARCPLR